MTSSWEVDLEKGVVPASREVNTSDGRVPFCLFEWNPLGESREDCAARINRIVTKQRSCYGKC